MTKIDDAIDVLDDAMNNTREALKILNESQRTIRSQYAMVWEAADSLYELLDINHNNGARCRFECVFCDALENWENIR